MNVLITDKKNVEYSIDYDVGSHNISVNEGVALTCKELYAKATEWQSHNG